VTTSLTRGAVAALAAVLVLGALAGCASPPPLLSQKQVDSGVLSPEHPELTEEQQADCEGCHKVE